MRVSAKYTLEYILMQCLKKVLPYNTHVNIMKERKKAHFSRGPFIRGQFIMLNSIHFPYKLRMWGRKTLSCERIFAKDICPVGHFLTDEIKRTLFAKTKVWTYFVKDIF